ncbi:MAG: hypothetical protein LBP93_09025 [Treponema sp.]|jgi:hypothetical protein|nr:hypothetical protein [Treponema sp.]
MKRIFRPLPAAMVLFVFIFLGSPLGAQGFFSRLDWSFRGSILFFPENNGLASDSMPILPSPGGTAAYPVWGPLWAELSLDVYGTYYGYAYQLGRAVPANPENRSSFVIGPILGFQGLAKFDVREKIGLRVYGGLSADMRICLIAGGLEGQEKEQVAEEVKDITAYFWGKGRWLFPVLGFGMDFGITEKLLLGFDTRVWFPMYRLWTNEDLPAIEGWRFGVGFNFTFK